MDSTSCCCKVWIQWFYKLIAEKVEEKNPLDNEGKTPLHEAIDNGHLHICRILWDILEIENPTLAEPEAKQIQIFLKIFVLVHARNRMVQNSCENQYWKFGEIYWFWNASKIVSNKSSLLQYFDFLAYYLVCFCHKAMYIPYVFKTIEIFYLAFSKQK
jgi:hypothetical protein